MSKETNQSRKNTSNKNNGRQNSKRSTDKTTNIKKTKANNSNLEKKEIKSKVEVNSSPEVEEEYNEDLEEMIEEEETLSNEKESVKDVKSKENIKKIEKIVKEKQKKVKKASKGADFLSKLEEYRYPIYSFIAGVLITTLIAFIIWPDRIAALKDGTEPVVKVNNKTYTADDLYENMKSYYSVSLLLDQIDSDLLTEKYPEDDAMDEEVKSNAEYYFNTYEQYYGYTQEEFLSKNGFSSYDAFLDYLRLDYRRNKYLDEYVEDNLTDKEIQDYYDENVFGDINTQHILVEVKDDDDSDDDSNKLSDDDAKALAEEIIGKLNDGTSWEQVQEDYKDKVTFEDLSYQSWDASLEDTFMSALKELDDNSYSKEPVKTSYGYHIIYRLDQKDKPSLEDSKEKIVDKLVSEKESDDSNLLYKALISLREEKNIEFSDTVMKSKYEDYCKEYK